MKFLFALFSLFLSLSVASFQMAHATTIHANQPQVAVIELGSISANGDVFGIYLPKKSKIEAVYVANGATINASDTDYFQISLQLGSTVIAELDSRAAHENGVTANTPKGLNLIALQSVRAAGSYLKATYVEAGTMALTNAKLIVVYWPY